VIRSILDKDIISITDIYNYYISETVITFEQSVVTPEDMRCRISKINADNLSWLVAENDSGEVIGYAYASKWRERFSYRFSVEVTVYLSPSCSGKKIGTQLYSVLFDELRRKSIHTVIGGITLPNPASIALHEKFGMKKVAHFEEVGYKFDQWLDVGYWQGRIDS